MSVRNHNIGRARGGHLKALVATVLLAALAPAGGGVLAQQGGPGSDLVSDYIARTDELILWARDLITGTDSGTARTVLRQAEDLNRQATRELGHGRTSQAGNLARRARSAVWHAVKLGREAMGLEDRLRLRAERFMDLHQQLSERARDAGNEEAVSLLQKAEGQAQRAREAHLQGDLRLAWQMFERAEDLTARAARLIADTGDPERLRAEIERTGELIERAREAQRGNASPQAARQLGEAEEALERARGHLAEGEPGRALQLTTLARRLAHAAFDESAPQPVAAAQRQIDRFDERVGALGDRLADQEDRRGRDLLEQAGRHRERAGSALAAGDPDTALREIRAAHDLLNQAETMLR